MSRAECKVAITSDLVEGLEEGDDLYSVISEAERLRLSYVLLNRVKLSNLKNTNEAFSEANYQRVDANECLLDFLKRHKIFKDITALHSRSRVIQKMLEFKVCKETGAKFDPKESLLKKSLKNWFVPVDLIRNYYGEEIAIYFEWMNYFLKWMIYPGSLGLVLWGGNQLFFDPETSPLNAVFAIFMSIWPALFSINWNKHERSLKVVWDNLFQSEHKIQ